LMARVDWVSPVIFYRAPAVGSFEEIVDAIFAEVLKETLHDDV